MTTFKNGVEQVAGAEVGGLYGINVETLSAGKTLTPGTDEIYQYLDPNGAHRIITLDTASATAGDRFVIRNNGAYNDTQYLNAKQATTTLDYIYARGIKEFIFDGTNWISGETGAGESGTGKYNLAIGYSSNGYGRGVGVGYGARGYTDGVGIGYNAAGYNQGVAVGYSTTAYTFGTTIGYNAEGNTYGVGVGASSKGNTWGVAVGYQAQTNTRRYSLALGPRSETTRVGETSINIDANSSQKNNVIQGRWSLTTTNNTPAEMFCAAFSTNRFTIRPSSALAFNMTIVARDNVANEVAMYTVIGLIKRDGSNNTVLVNVTVTTVYEDDASWDVAVTADDTNESLKIEVTGDASNPVQWATVMDGVETHF